MKLHEDMVVQSEIVDELFEEDFTTADDADIQHDLEKKFEALGLDPRLAQQVVQKNRSDELGPAVVPAAQPFSKIPARQWKEAKRRLDEQARHTARVLLNRVGLTPKGIEIPRKLKPEIGAINNTIAAYMMVNQAIAKKVGDGRKRPEWSCEEFTAAMEELPGILQNLVRQLKRIQKSD